MGGDKKTESVCEGEKERDHISTRRAIVESRWDSEKYTNDSFLGKRQRGEGPRISILMNINNLYIKSLFNIFFCFF